MDLDRTPWLRGVHPRRAVRLHPRRVRQPLDPGSSKMEWPFLWPAEEPWPVRRQRDPELASRLEAGLKRAEVKGIDSDRDREITTLLIERYRSGHNAAYLPVLQLSRPEFPELPFSADSTLDPERIDDYPSRFEVALPSVASQDSEEDSWRAMEDLGPAPGTKLLGFPKWIQGPDYPRCQ